MQNFYFRCSMGNFYFINNPFNIYNEDKDEIEYISLLEIQNYYKIFEQLFKIERKTSTLYVSFPNMFNPYNSKKSNDYYNEIQIFDKKPKPSDQPIHILKGHTQSITSVHYMKERYVLLSASLDHTLRIWNLDTFECIWVSNGVKFGMINNIIQLDNDRVIIEGEDKEIIIVNIDK